MNNIEERLWNYIDGTCTTAEQQAIGILIAQDEAWRSKYQELQSFNMELTKIEIDEPSMAFTFKVMESIRAEHAQKPLKAMINKRIIWAISAFFVFTISLLLIYVFSTVRFSMPGNSSLDVQLYNIFKTPDVKGVFNGPVVKAFLFFDIVLGLFLFDAFLRKPRATQSK